MGDEQVSLAAGTGLVAIVSWTRTMRVMRSRNSSQCFRRTCGALQAGFLILRALRQRRKQEEFMARTADDTCQHTQLTAARQAGRDD